MRWSPEQRKEMIRLKHDGARYRDIAPLFNTTPGAVRHAINRAMNPYFPRRQLNIPFEARSEVSAQLLADREHRRNLPDTPNSLLMGDPKPGSGQSALEQMRR